MNPEIKTQWVNALRSGDYKQGRLKLTNVEGDEKTYCCLGVLCDLAVKAGAIPEPTPLEEDNEKFLRYGVDHEESAFLPIEVIEWAGSPDTHSFNSIPLEYKGETHNADYLNDITGLNFNELADLIDSQL
jgi:hypothetical protein